jgi:hypothetical protein
MWLISPNMNETLATWVQTQFKRTDPRPKFVGGLKIRLKTRARYGTIYTVGLKISRILNRHGTMKEYQQCASKKVLILEFS